MNQKTIGTLLAAAMLVLTALVGVAAPAAAQTTTTADTTDTSAPLNETVAVDGDARALYVSATNATGVLDATVHAVENGSETQVANSTLDATANTTGSWEWSLPTDPADEYRVIVDGASVESVDLYTVEKVAAGGGFMPSDGQVPMKTVGIGLVALLVVLGGVSYYADGRPL